MGYGCSNPKRNLWREIPEKISEIAKAKIGLEKKARLPSYHPFEFHLVKPEEAEPFLRRAGKDLLRLH